MVVYLTYLVVGKLLMNASFSIYITKRNSNRIFVQFIPGTSTERCSFHRLVSFYSPFKLTSNHFINKIEIHLHTTQGLIKQLSAKFSWKRRPLTIKALKYTRSKGP